MSSKTIQSVGEGVKAPKECLQFDARFPNQHQSRNCFQNILDYQRCIKIKGEDYEPCRYFRYAYRNICPKDMCEKFEETIDNNVFPGRIPEKV